MALSDELLKELIGWVHFGRGDGADEGEP
ncbi:hypothetical protein SBA5_200007 [Candidatus Sulfotelmatomonas gaucii]|uniref:Uncharacterized protein n=1 Tax=Candidatus Sulfuritelmatomonas gaucii TaxID=2043161 RepID=A0A2N9L7X8_9BACT|nr:hypothetical protein SBA5_200007 [Candidatus Sulfotelmatomonas gaucii]